MVMLLYLVFGGGYEILIVMLVLCLDVVFVYLNFGDSYGNVVYIGIDFYFDDFFLMVVEWCFLLVECIVVIEELVKLVLL